MRTVAATSTRSKLLALGLCSAKRRESQTGRGKERYCRLPMGYGTNHPGIGLCKFHGGSTPSGIKNASNTALESLMGEPMEINPLDAILWCIRITAGEVEWLSAKMAELDEEDWIEQTDMGRQMHIWARLRGDKLKDLAKFSHMAVSLGLAERQVKLAENYGNMIGRLIKGILDDLHLDDAQRKIAPEVVRRRLIMVNAMADGQEVPAALLNPAPPHPDVIYDPKGKNRNGDPD